MSPGPLPLMLLSTLMVAASLASPSSERSSVSILAVPTAAEALLQRVLQPQHAAQFEIDSTTSPGTMV